MPDTPAFGAFPTTISADDKAKLLQVLYTRRLSPDLVEPVYDVIGFFLGKVFGGSAAPTFGAALGDHDGVEAMDHLDLQKFVEDLDASHPDDHVFGAGVEGPIPTAVWHSALKSLLMLVAGLL